MHTHTQALMGEKKVTSDITFLLFSFGHLCPFHSQTPLQFSLV